MTTLKVNSKEEAYEALLQNYKENDCCFDMLVSTISLAGLSIEDTFWVYAKLQKVINDIDILGAEFDFDDGVTFTSMLEEYYEELFENIKKFVSEDVEEMFEEV